VIGVSRPVRGKQGGVVRGERFRTKHVAAVATKEAADPKRGAEQWCTEAPREGGGKRQRRAACGEPS
jgi:hypothetical protein